VSNSLIEDDVEINSLIEDDVEIKEILKTWNICKYLC